MKASLISKIILVICILCLIAGFIKMDRYKPYSESDRNKTITNSNKIAVIELDGAIASSYESSLFAREASAPSLLKSLVNAQTDNEIKGVIVKINSPGGTVAMSQNIYNQIMKLRQKKPVIVVMDDVAASGGYYIASAADRIIAQEGTLTGSIGVIFSIMDYHNLLTSKLSIKPVVIKSGKYKDIGSGLRERTADDNLLKYADGRVFTGRIAKKLGFVDSLGDIDTAKNEIEIMCREKFNNKLPVKLIEYNKKSPFSEYFSSFAEYNSKSNIKLTDFVPQSMILSRKPLYLWE